MAIQIPKYKIKWVDVSEEKAKISDIFVEGYFYSDVHDIYGRQICEGDIVAFCKEEQGDSISKTLYQVQCTITNNQPVFYIEDRAGKILFQKLSSNTQLVVITSIADLMLALRTKEKLVTHDS